MTAAVAARLKKTARQLIEYSGIARHLDVQIPPAQRTETGKTHHQVSIDRILRSGVTTKVDPPGGRLCPGTRGN
ncbi:hypothetical protein D3C84_914340 [compost metagenome]